MVASPMESPAATGLGLGMEEGDTAVPPRTLVAFNSGDGSAAMVLLVLNVAMGGTPVPAASGVRGDPSTGKAAMSVFHLTSKCY